jgi:hypothetical protein
MVCALAAIRRLAAMHASPCVVIQHTGNLSSGDAWSVYCMAEAAGTASQMAQPAEFFGVQAVRSPRWMKWHSSNTDRWRHCRIQEFSRANHDPGSVARSPTAGRGHRCPDSTPPAGTPSGHDPAAEWPR